MMYLHPCCHGRQNTVINNFGWSPCFFTWCKIRQKTSQKCGLSAYPVCFDYAVVDIIIFFILSSGIIALTQITHKLFSKVLNNGAFIDDFHWIFVSARLTCNSNRLNTFVLKTLAQKMILERRLIELSFAHSTAQNVNLSLNTPRS